MLNLPPLICSDLPLKTAKRIHTHEKSKLKLAFHTQQGVMAPMIIDEFHQRISTREREDFKVDDNSVKTRLVPNQTFKYNFTKSKQS
mgnify:CR=1 FL=1